MCCLMYEHETYVQARRRFPKEGKILRTDRGEEKVATVDIWRETVTLRDPEGNRRTVPLGDIRSEVARASASRGPGRSDPPGGSGNDRNEESPDGDEGASN